jgi:ribonuclease HII
MDLGRLTIAECRALLARTLADDLDVVLGRMSRDARKGVRRLAETARRAAERDRAEEARLHAMSARQRELHSRGYAVVAGVDEVGRGALAGPVSAGAVVLSIDALPRGLDDSKRLTPERRERLAAVLSEVADAWAVAHAPAHVIDAIGIVAATTHAMRGALDALGMDLDHVFVDGTALPLEHECTYVPKGDRHVASIAAASILAKVERDRLMAEMGGHYPGYGLAENKGYGTVPHSEAIRDMGPSPIHRRSFGLDSSQSSLF